MGKHIEEKKKEKRRKKGRGECDLVGLILAVFHFFSKDLTSAKCIEPHETTVQAKMHRSKNSNTQLVVYL